MQPDPDELLTAWDWIARAKSALAIAKQPRPDGVFWEDLCYQLQQATEKSVRAFYLAKGLSFRYTHDLEELGDGLVENGVPIPEVLKEAVDLSRYAIETRYPGVYAPVTEDDYRKALAIAQAVVAWVEGNIPR